MQLGTMTNICSICFLMHIATLDAHLAILQACPHEDYGISTVPSVTHLRLVSFYPGDIQHKHISMYMYIFIHTHINEYILYTEYLLFTVSNRNLPISHRVLEEILRYLKKHTNSAMILN